MLTLVIMVLITAFLGGLLWFQDEEGRGSTFFDMEATTAMRGFWCLIILLVHVPSAHQNVIQDLLGSFAYIGVTFFFMTSGYGLMLGVQRKGAAALERFWQRRLTKLLVPMVLMNLLMMLCETVFAGRTQLRQLVSITGFVRQLLLFYFLFWAWFKIPGLTPKHRTRLICLSVAAVSLLIYMTDGFHIFGWPVESFGFLYGIVLAEHKDSFRQRITRKWLLSCGIACAASLVFGILYLKTKTVVFFGDYLIKILLGQSILAFMLALNAGRSLGNPVSRFLGKISYEIYLLHNPAFFCLDALVQEWDSGMYVLGSIVLTVLFSVLIHRASGVILGIRDAKT